jgi:hypothetical protein
MVCKDVVYVCSLTFKVCLCFIILHWYFMAPMLQCLPIIFTLSCTRCSATALQHGIDFFPFPSCGAIVFTLFVLLSYVLCDFFVSTTKIFSFVIMYMQTALLSCIIYMS